MNSHTEKEKIRLKGIPTFAVVAGLFLTIIALAVMQNQGYAIDTADLPTVRLPDSTQTSPLINVTITSPIPTLTPNNNLNSNNEATSLHHSEGIKVFGQDHSTELQGINWGTITVGRMSYYQIYVTNIGDSPVTLKLSVTNWTPGVNGLLSWNYDNKPLQVDDTVSIVFYLQISTATGDSFNNDIVITSNAV